MVPGIIMAASFGKTLKRFREKAGLTQEALARAAGLSTSFLSKLEQKDHDPSWATVQALAKALGIATDEFVSEEASEPEKPARKVKPKGK